MWIAMHAWQKQIRMLSCLLGPPGPVVDGVKARPLTLDGPELRVSNSVTKSLGVGIGPFQLNTRCLSGYTAWSIWIMFSC